LFQIFNEMIKDTFHSFFFKIHKTNFQPFFNNIYNSVNWNDDRERLCFVE
jgi:hypothetical protein